MLSRVLFSLLFLSAGWFVADRFVSGSGRACPAQHPAGASAGRERPAHTPFRATGDDALEELWAASTAVTEEDERALVKRELEQRYLHFSLFEERHAQGPAVGDLGNEVMGLAAELGIRETLFLMGEADAGRVRRAPPGELPQEVQTDPDLELQLVPLFSSEADVVYLFRLELADQTGLFLDRREVGRIGVEAMQALHVAGVTSLEEAGSALVASREETTRQ